MRPKDTGETHTWNVDAATEETDRHCTVCGYVAEEQIGHVHEGTLVAGKEATCTENGNIEYWRCETCGKYFSDEALTQEIEKEATIIKSKGHGETELKIKRKPAVQLKDIPEIKSARSVARSSKEARMFQNLGIATKMEHAPYVALQTRNTNRSNLLIRRLRPIQLDLLI